MYRYRRQHRVKHKDNSDRWLVSYADYMTLMFALFVVLYAFVLLEKDEFKEVVSNLESAVQRVAKPYPKNTESGAAAQGAAKPCCPMAPAYWMAANSLKRRGRARWRPMTAC